MISKKFFNILKRGPPTPIDYNLNMPWPWWLTESKLELKSREDCRLCVSNKMGISSAKTFSETKMSIEQNLYRINKFTKPSRKRHIYGNIIIKRNIN